MDNIVKLSSELDESHAPVIFVLTLVIVALPVGRIDGVVFSRLPRAFSGPLRTRG